MADDSTTVVAGTKRPGSPLDADARVAEGPAAIPGASAEATATSVPSSSTQPEATFSSPIVTLIVGPDRKKLTAHQSVLTKVDYFKACLAPDRFLESETMSITLPEDEPAVIAQILHCLYHEKLEKGCDDGVPADWDKMATLEKAEIRWLYLKCYTTADKICLENMSNALVDWFITDFASGAVYWMLSIDTLIQAIRLEDSLIKLLTVSLAWAIRTMGWDGLKDKTYKGLDDDFARYPQVAHVLAKALVSPDYDKETCPCLKYPRCHWHVHQSTPICGVNPALRA